MGTKYDTDILAWSEHQAELLRCVGAGEKINHQVDWPHVIEEVEAVGRSEQSAVASHIRTIIEHLAKLEASPALEPRIGWQETVLRARGDIEAVLEGSPSLRPNPILARSSRASTGERCGWPAGCWCRMERYRECRWTRSAIATNKCLATGCRTSESVSKHLDLAYGLALAIGATARIGGSEHAREDLLRS